MHLRILVCRASALGLFFASLSWSILGCGQMPAPPEANVLGRAPGASVLTDLGFEPAGSMKTARTRHTATLLGGDRVLVAGGANDVSLKSAEVYDPTSGSFTPVGSMSAAREEHTATPISSGRVLVSGGTRDDGYLDSAEVYTPEIQGWEGAGVMSAARTRHTATLLDDGRVLVVGGVSRVNDIIMRLASAEVYSPESRTWAPAKSMNTARDRHTATLLANGRVLVLGGTRDDGPVASAEVYNPKTDSWALTKQPMNAERAYHTATLLEDGRVLVLGGIGAHGLLDSAEVYNPKTDGFTPVRAMSTAREEHTATRLPKDRVLVVGGSDTSESLDNAELYDAKLDAWSAPPSMSVARARHTATLMPDDQVLVAGGHKTGPLDSAEVFRLRTAGAACAAHSECQSYRCVENVCDGVCLRFRCDDSSPVCHCLSTCSSVKECADGFACDPSSHECVEAPPLNSRMDYGDCSVTGPSRLAFSPRWSLSPSLFLLAAFAALRRQRARDRPGKAG